MRAIFVAQRKKWLLSVLRCFNETDAPTKREMFILTAADSSTATFQLDTDFRKFSPFLFHATICHLQTPLFVSPPPETTHLLSIRSPSFKFSAINARALLNKNKPASPVNAPQTTTPPPPKTKRPIKLPSGVPPFSVRKPVY